MAHSSTATVVASYGKRGVLETAAGRRPFILKGRQLRPVCGDHVEFTATGNDDEALLTAIGARRNTLQRPDHRGKAEAIAANLDRLAVVMAPEPAPDCFITDRFIGAAEFMRTDCLIVWNKCDLGSDVPAELDEYARLGYPVLQTSVVSGTGIAELRRHLSGGLAMLVGQSGVGKSSLINALVPAADILTGELSDASREGRHTTTASFAHALPDGGLLIDSPGIRDFVPAVGDPGEVRHGFREIAAIGLNCRFADCQHTREPNCAVKQAVDDGTVSARRYESYKRLRNLTAQTARGGSQ